MNRSDRQKKIGARGILAVLAVLAATSAVILGLIWGFYSFISSYNDNITVESASHLVEISHQVASYIEDKIDSDWKAAESIVSSLQILQEKDPIELIEDLRNIWGISNVMKVMVHLNDGRCVDIRGNPIRAGETPELAYGLGDHERHMSCLLYTSRCV